MDIVRHLYSPVAKRAARNALIGRVRARQAPERGRFMCADVDRLLDEAWTRYRQRAPGLPPRPTIGSAMNVRLACFTMSFFDALLAAGVERPYAVELIADAAWRVYRQWARIALALGFAPIRRDRASLGLPFNAPGYLIETAPSERRTAFDVVKLPISQLFPRRGRSRSLPRLLVRPGLRPRRSDPRRARAHENPSRRRGTVRF